MSGAKEIAGRCLCGSVRFTAAPKEHIVGICHCEMCRRWAGGSFFAIDCGDTVKFESTEDLAIYPSSEWGERGFCKKCGSSLFWKMRDKLSYEISVNALEDPGDLILDHEIFIDDKPDYYAFAGDAKKMTGAEVFAAAAAEAKEE